MDSDSSYLAAQPFLSCQPPSSQGKGWREPQGLPLSDTPGGQETQVPVLAPSHACLVIANCFHSASPSVSGPGSLTHLFSALFAESREDFLNSGDLIPEVVGEDWASGF